MSLDCCCIRPLSLYLLSPLALPRLSFSESCAHVASVLTSQRSLSPYTLQHTHTHQHIAHASSSNPNHQSTWATPPRSTPNPWRDANCVTLLPMMCALPASHSPKTRRKRLSTRMKSFSLDAPDPPKQLLGIDELTKKKSSSFTNTCFGKFPFSLDSISRDLERVRLSAREGGAG